MGNVSNNLVEARANISTSSFKLIGRRCTAPFVFSQNKPPATALNSNICVYANFNNAYKILLDPEKFFQEIYDKRILIINLKLSKYKNKSDFVISCSNDMHVA